MQLERGGARLDLLDQPCGLAGVALTGERQVDRQALGRQQHALYVPWPRRTGRGVGPSRRACATADESSDARRQRLVHLLRADVVDVRIDAAGGDDLALAGDDLGAWADDDGDTGLDVGVARLADRSDAPGLE